MKLHKLKEWNWKKSPNENFLGDAKPTRNEKYERRVELGKKVDNFTLIDMCASPKICSLPVCILLAVIFAELNLPFVEMFESKRLKFDLQ